jgi:hypothetical protein
VLLTEDESKQKWCPFARTLFVAEEDGGWEAESDFPVHNRLMIEGRDDQGFSGDEEVDQGKTCLGSRCMAWRWAPSVLRSDDGEKVGYCGLAGTPSRI